MPAGGGNVTTVRWQLTFSEKKTEIKLTEFVFRANAMYRTLLATCGSEEMQSPRKCNVPHVARNVWIRGKAIFVFSGHKYIEKGDRFSHSAEPHVASNVRYIAFAMKPRGIAPFR